MASQRYLPGLIQGDMVHPSIGSVINVFGADVAQGCVVGVIVDGETGCVRAQPER